jgi:hypothetical protein
MAGSNNGTLMLRSRGTQAYSQSPADNLRVPTHNSSKTEKQCDRVLSSTELSKCPVSLF